MRMSVLLGKTTPVKKTIMSASFEKLKKDQAKSKFAALIGLKKKNHDSRNKKIGQGIMPLLKEKEALALKVRIDFEEKMKQQIE